MRSLNELLIVSIIPLVLSACTAADFQWSLVEDTPDAAAQAQPETDDAEIPAADDNRSVATREIVVIERQIEPSRKLDRQGMLLTYANDYLALPPEAQREEFNKIESEYLNEQTDVNLVRYALLTTLADPAPEAAENRVRSDLQSYLDGKEPLTEVDELYTLSAFLLHLLETRERLLTQLTSQNQELQRKLDELKEIEQQLRERDSTQIIRTPP